MAIPGDRLSSLYLTGHFLSPDDLDNYPLLDFELGGVGLNDASEGQRYQVWTCRYFPATGDFVVEAPNTPPTIVHNAMGVTELSFTFDNNMQVFIAYVQSGQAKFYWWDTNIAGFTVSNLPAGSLTPKCCLDDKRETQTTANDIILCYVDGGALYERKQRERYQTAHLLEDPFLHPVYGLPAVIKRVGMNVKNRLQWVCDLADPIDWCGYVNYGN